VDLNSILLLRGNEVRDLLQGRERDVIDAVAAAYVAHGVGDSALPHSTFLRFPHDERSRIIALPAFVGGKLHVAGMKWIASFPGNLAAGQERASATIILNSADTGRPRAILEASLISARRTAASAALAASRMHAGLDATRVGIVGCGPISLEMTRFLSVVFPEMRELVLFDLSRERAEHFADVLRREVGEFGVTIAASTAEVLASAPLVAFGTTAGTPHVGALPARGPRPQTILNVSLRDLAPEIILGADNVVDDADHVCRAATSLHLAEEASGSRDFIRCSLADILDGRAPARRDGDSVAIFSPFGLGVLDMAVAQLVYDLAADRNEGTVFDGFLPDPWDAQREAALPA
jgi:ornithine cyclodeaminase